MSEEFVGNVEDEEGCLHQSKGLRNQIIRGYLGTSVRDAILMKNTPLMAVLERRATAVFEADTTFTFASHLKTALVARCAPKRLGDDGRPPWLMLTYQRAISILWNEGKGTENAESITPEQLSSRYDPPIVDLRGQNFYAKPTEALMACLVSRRDHYNLPTILLTHRISELPDMPERFHPELLKWIKAADGDCMSHIRASVSQVRGNARNPEKAKDQLALFNRTRTRVVNADTGSVDA